MPVAAADVSTGHSRSTLGVRIQTMDARLILWEATCECGGADTADIRMCRCRAANQSGLTYEGCGGGVLLPKDGPRGTFFGCSLYKQ